MITLLQGNYSHTQQGFKKNPPGLYKDLEKIWTIYTLNRQTHIEYGSITTGNGYATAVL